MTWTLPRWPVPPNFDRLPPCSFPTPARHASPDNVKKLSYHILLASAVARPLSLPRTLPLPPAKYMSSRRAGAGCGARTGDVELLGDGGHESGMVQSTRTTLLWMRLRAQCRDEHW